MKNKRALSILLVAALTTAAAGCSGGGSVSTATAVDMRLQRTIGQVTLANEKGENISLMERMRLNAGSTMSTAKESLAIVSLNEDKALTVEENGSAVISQQGKELKIDVKEGNAIINLAKELEDGQAVSVRCGNINCGIKGTVVSIEAGNGPESGGEATA